jgi:cytochrome o ubiquinol oxidase subunit 2
MRFKFLGMSAADFDRWVQKAKAANSELSRDAYLKLEQPSEREPVRRYRAVALDLFDAVVNRCVEQGKTCLRDTMAMDMHRTSGSPSLRDSVAWSPLGAADSCTADSFAGSALLANTYRD